MRCDKLCLLYKSREQHLPSPLSQHDYLIQISYVDRKRGQCGTPSSMRWKAPRNEDASRSKWKVSFATGNRKVSFAEAVGLIFHLQDAAKRALPHATQVADRYHLVHNLREHLQQFLDRKRTCLPEIEDSPLKAGSTDGQGLASALETQTSVRTSRASPSTVSASSTDQAWAEVQQDLP